MQQINLRVKGWGRPNLVRNAKEKSFEANEIKKWLCNLFELIA
jgi:hypothetical protein